jgi:hypothetical protein
MIAAIRDGTLEKISEIHIRTDTRISAVPESTRASPKTISHNIVEWRARRTSKSPRKLLKMNKFLLMHLREVQIGGQIG